MARGSLRTVGRDVLFTHWPVDPDALRSRVPETLSIATFEGSAWVTILAIREVNAGLRGLTIERSGPGLICRTYVRRGESGERGDAGVFFLGVDAGDRLGVLIGRRAFELPVSRARIRTVGRPDPFEFRSRRGRFGGPSARFHARYRPTGETSRTEPGSLEAFLTERSRFFVREGGRGRACGSDRSSDRRSRSSAESSTTGEKLQIGEITRSTWWLQEVRATVEASGYFEAIGLDAPSAEPRCLYSPGFRISTGRPRPTDPR